MKTRKTTRIVNEGQMALRSFMLQRNVNVVAAALWITPSYLHNLLSGCKKPAGPLRRLIEIETGVPATSWDKEVGTC